MPQYLANKGPEIAGEAAVALERVGARRTARLLRAALAAPQESRRLDSLDLRFQKTAEDLPGLTMEFLGKRRG